MSYDIESGGESLESPGVGSFSNQTPPNNPTPPAKKPLSNVLKFAVPTALLILLLIGLLAYTAGRSEKPVKRPLPTPVTINTQTLDSGTLSKLTVDTNNTATRQQLTISPDTIFRNGVQVQGDLRADKTLSVGGSLTVQNATTLRGAVTISNTLAVGGSLSVGGVLTAGSLNVGTLNVSSVNSSGNIGFAGHIVPGGATPQVQASVGSSGGTATISGNDTAGTVTITIGSDTLIAGEMAIITFRTPFATTPKVQLTPINPAASGLNYYASRSSRFLTIESSTVPVTGTTYVYDYLVTQ